MKKITYYKIPFNFGKRHVIYKLVNNHWYAYDDSGNEWYYRYRPQGYKLDLLKISEEEAFLEMV